MSLPALSGRSLAPSNITEAVEFSERLAASSLVPSSFKGKPADVLVAMQWGYELGLSPLQALQNIAVINGKPSVYGDTLLALVQGHPEYAGHKEWLEGEVAHCLIQRRKGQAVIDTERTFSVTDAKRANLWGKGGPWQQYPQRMLQMRARGFALRDAFADALRGFITVEEAQDYPVAGKAAPKDITPVNPLDAISPQVEPVAEVIEAEVIQEPAVRFVLLVPERGERGKRELFFGAVGEWCNAFVKEAGAIVNDKAADLEARRHDLAEFKKANDMALEFLKAEHPEEHSEIADRYKKAIRLLSAKAKEG
jgi:hypothetical protein